MEQILTATSIIGAIVLGATQIIKQTSINNKLLPFLNILVGMGIGALYALSFVKADIITFTWAGALAGMAAGGFYDLKSNGVAFNNEKKSQKLIEDDLGKQDLGGE